MSSIQNQMLQVTVVECAKLKDTEWISRQDPYICLEYGSTKFRTRTCTDGGKTPVFQEKFMFTLIEGLREMNVVVHNSNTLTTDDFIGSGKIQLQDVLYKGYDDKYWPIHTKSGRYAGEVKLIMYYSQHDTPAVSYSSTPPPYLPPNQPQVLSYSAPPPPPPAYTNPACPPPYLPQSSAYPNPMPYTSYPNPMPYTPYPPPQQTYSPYPYPPPDRSIYPPPPDGYPTTTYPPPPHTSPYIPPGSYGIYPPPPY